MFSENVQDVFDMRPLFAQLSAPLLRDAARTYVTRDRYVQVTLLPEGK